MGASALQPHLQAPGGLALPSPRCPVAPEFREQLGCLRQLDRWGAALAHRVWCSALGHGWRQAIVERAGAGGEVTEDTALRCPEPWEPSPQDGPQGMEVTGGAPTCPPGILAYKSFSPKQGFPNSATRGDTLGSPWFPVASRASAHPTPNLSAARQGVCILSAPKPTPKCFRPATGRGLGLPGGSVVKHPRWSPGDKGPIPSQVDSDRTCLAASRGP